MLKRISALIAALFAVLIVLSGCGRKKDTPSVYFLNFKPEQDSQWKALAKVYTEKTGVPLYEP